MTEHVRECSKCGYTGVHHCGCEGNQVPTEHVCEWKVILSLSKNIYAVCPTCDACMDKEEIEARLNATERLSAELATAILGFITRKLGVWHWTEALIAYANILEGKDD